MRTHIHSTDDTANNNTALTQQELQMPPIDELSLTTPKSQTQQSQIPIHSPHLSPNPREQGAQKNEDERVESLPRPTPSIPSNSSNLGTWNASNLGANPFMGCLDPYVLTQFTQGASLQQLYSLLPPSNATAMANNKAMISAATRLLATNQQQMNANNAVNMQTLSMLASPSNLASQIPSSLRRSAPNIASESSAFRPINCQISDQVDTSGILHFLKGEFCLNIQISSGISGSNENPSARKGARLEQLFATGSLYTIRAIGN